MKNTIVYKFRAECKTDINNLIKAIPVKNIVSKSKVTKLFGDYPDVLMTLTLKRINLKELRIIMNNITDGHVMAQTVALLKEYTGVRDYDIR